MNVPIKPDTQDWDHLTRDLDKTKSAAFCGKNAAFLGSILCSMDFVWSTQLPTAATNGLILWWNPEFFKSLSIEARQTVLMHELWHPARLHFARQGNRNNDIWNYACDIRINNDLKDEGYSFVGLENSWMNSGFKPGTPEEDIYDELIKQGVKPPPNCPFGSSNPGTGDMIQCDPGDKDAYIQGINNVVRAVQQAKAAHGVGGAFGDIEQILNRFLTPVVPWEQVLHNFMRDLYLDVYTWSRRNRRFRDIYMPSTHQDEGRLSHLMYFEDVSGSISDEDVVRFNSEIRYVKEAFNPPKMSLVQFDTQITQVIELDEDTPFNRVQITGRGGTSLVPVREYIIKHKPTAVIIFTDMDCEPMATIPFEISIIWICIRNQKATVPFGKIVHIH